MLNSHKFEVIAGRDVVDAINDRRAAGGDLVRQQEADANAGFLGAELVESSFGWSVRYDSGLQDWGLLASSRRGDVDGSRASAEAWAKTWQARDPSRRYVWARR